MLSLLRIWTSSYAARHDFIADWRASSFAACRAPQIPLREALAAGWPAASFRPGLLAAVPVSWAGAATRLWSAHAAHPRSADRHGWRADRLVETAARDGRGPASAARRRGPAGPGHQHHFPHPGIDRRRAGRGGLPGHRQRHPHRAGHRRRLPARPLPGRSEEHTSELQSQFHLVCRLLLEKKKNKSIQFATYNKKKIP